MEKLIITILIASLAIMGLISPVQAHEEEYCDDQVSREIATFRFPKKLTAPEEPTFQEAARYRQFYIFTDSFEGDSFSSAFYTGSGTGGWRLERGAAKNGQGMAVFDEHLEGLSEQTITADTNNWVVLGPFDLSTPKEADFNFYVQLGDGETGQSASLSALVSIDGSTFYGYRFSGTTCGWYYQNIDLMKVPHLGNVCGESSVWFAFVPSFTPSAPGGKIALDYLRLLTHHPELAAEFKIAEGKPAEKSGEPSVSYHALTEWYSPVIYQDVGCTIYGDYITRIDYDGDYVGSNNWDNLGYPTKARPLPAYVYCSVIETDTHYFICYALFHPADDFHCHTFSHENDLEGIVMCVLKDGSTYGRLRLVQLQAHNDYYQYKVTGETGISDRNEDTDGTIKLDTTHPGVHPTVYVEGGGHGIRHEDTGDWPSVIYYYSGNAQDPDVVGHSHCGYDLLSISAEMWERRTNCCGSGYLFDNWGNYQGRRYSVAGLGRQFDGDSGTQSPDMASPPWSWADNDDDPDWSDGDWFMDSAGYHDWQFRWTEDFSTSHIFHPFLYSHLGGDIYNGKGGATTLSHGPYDVVYDVTILPDQVLAIKPGIAVNLRNNTGIISDGGMEADGSGGTIRFLSSQNPGTGIKLDGKLRVQNGGCIRVP